jgi:hypothetical protein
MFVVNPQETEEVEEPDGLDPVRDNEIICKKLKSPLFQVVTLVHLENVVCLDVHRGPRPQVEV